ncbi:hypothetical protein ACFPIJ_37280 [Dactylosporangium cerinum]|jgi:hypothetical protein|uniref:Uncharacterized protein n=1 Tax=Dactylosporangium cerinum TaxID=1434730 RepID=A0ABV9W489_9ACTN
MQTSPTREVALVVGVAAAGVLTAALIVIGPVAAADAPRYPQVTDVRTPVHPQP